MTEAHIKEFYGWAEIDPIEPVVAGSTGTWRITYHAGKYGVDDGGVLKFAWRDVSDWAYPQFDDPPAPNYASIATTGPSSLRAQFEKQRFVRPWRLCVTVDVFDDSLVEGDTVTLTLGDTAGGSPGSRAQTFCKEAFEFRVAVDWCGTWKYTVVPSPVFEIVPGAASNLVVVGPSLTSPNEDAWIGIKAEDVWGNPCRGYDGEVTIEDGGLSGLPGSVTFGPDDRGVKRFERVRAPEPGVFRVQASDVDNGLYAEGNPLECRSSVSGPRPFWGDLHGQSEETVGTNPVKSYFEFARELALVDFAGHQGNDFQITKAVWDEIKLQANRQNDPGRYVVFVGWEWSGNTPVGGDHNVYYPSDDGPLHRSSHVLIDDKSDVQTDAQHVTDLYAALKGTDTLLVPHVGGRYANLSWHDGDFESVVEVYSEWGEFEWFLKEALEKGYRVGFTAGSDDHKGRPGAAYPGSGSFGVYGGLTCVQAESLTREGVWAALRARRCYGTTGQRILIDAKADGHPIGSVFEADSAPEIVVNVVGTAPIERIDIVRGLDEVHSYPANPERSHDRIRIAWSGQRIRARNRLARWDGSLTLEGGTLWDAAGYAFDSASEGITDTTDKSIAWTSVTTGDADGVTFTVDGSDDATIDFRTPIVSRSLRLGTIKMGPVTIDAGGVDMKVVFEMTPVGIGREASVRFRDEDAPPGTHPYWIRVVQTDGSKAWVSPFYVTLVDGL